ncbi:MAG: type III secretion inner membrane ring lipoprotein SctJ [Parachlamydiales bacterium]|nr:type III secretion inner membrane ring lipoprotein SctJ [Parachlamydiales bacterium]
MSFRTFFSFIALLMLVVGLTGCSSQLTIVNDVDEQQANEIVVFLASKGIIAEKVVSSSGSETSAVTGPVAIMYNIAVDPSQATDAMSILNRNGLPRPSGTTLLDIFGQPGLVPTDLEEQIRYHAGLSQQIASTLRKIDGVLDADVIVSYPPADTTGPITASVLIKHQGVMDNPNSHLITKIQQLVASSVTGLRIENVTVVSDRARYMDVTSSDDLSLSIENKELLSVWGITVASDSTGRMRTILVTFSILLIFLLAALGWLVWKLMPVLSKDNWKNLVSLKSMTLEPKTEEVPVQEVPPLEEDIDEDEAEDDEDKNPNGT